MKIIVDNKEIELIYANTFFKRLKGLMFKKNIDYCLRIKTNCIHTMFMKKNIDIIMTDKYNNILYIFNNIKKNKFIIKKNVYYTYEFPAHFLKNNLKTITIKENN